jgi:hypothetical protein
VAKCTERAGAHAQRTTSTARVRTRARTCLGAAPGHFCRAPARAIARAHAARME